MIGLTIMTIPLPPHHRRTIRTRLGRTIALRLPSWRRVLCLVLGFLYPFTILVAIVATANHFILDAIAGALVCALGWWFNGVLLNLLPIEDCFLWIIRIHKPEPSSVRIANSSDGWESEEVEPGQADLAP
jgi:cytochrome c biogenesis protein CcdA